MPTRTFKAGAVLAGLALFAAWPSALFAEYLGSLSRGAEEFDHTQAIVSLAGGSGRLGKGLDLLEEGRADVLLLSGTGKGARLEDIFPERDLSHLEAGNVILLENRSTSTYENAIEAWAVLAARGEVKEIVLLTSNYHMLRAEYVFRKVFPSDVKIVVYPVGTEHVERGAWYRNGKARQIVMTEYAKYVWYRLRY